MAQVKLKKYTNQSLPNHLFSKEKESVNVRAAIILRSKLLTCVWKIEYCLSVQNTTFYYQNNLHVVKISKGPLFDTALHWLSIQDERTRRWLNKTKDFLLALQSFKKQVDD